MNKGTFDSGPIPSYAPISISMELGEVNHGCIPELRILYVLGGTAILTYNGLSRHKLEPGSIYIINPQSFFAVSNADNFTAVTFSIDMTTFYAQMPTLSNVRFSVQNEDTCQEDYDTLSQLLLNILKIFSEKHEEQTLLLTSNTYNLLLVLLKKFRQPSAILTSISNSYDSTIQKLMLYIDQNFHKKLSLPMLSEMVYLNPQYLSRLFRKETGVTLLRYINQVRILKSEQDILNGSLSTMEIAEKYGFSNTKSFYKAFHDVFGKTPGEYKSDKKRKASNPQNFKLHSPISELYITEIRQLLQHNDKKLPLNFLLPDHDHQTFNGTEHRVRVPISAYSGQLYKHWSFSLPPGIPEDSFNKMNIPEASRHIIGNIKCHSSVLCDYSGGWDPYDFSYLDDLTNLYISNKMFLAIQLYPPPALLCYRFMPCDTTDSISMDGWLSFVSALVRHMYDRFNQEIMHTVRFYLPVEILTHLHDDKAFFDFIAITCKEILSIDPKLIVGLGGIDPEYISNDWLSSLGYALKKINTTLSFIDCKISYLQPDFEASPDDRKYIYKLTDCHRPIKLICELRQRMLNCGLPGVKLYITSVSPTGIHEDYTQNTSFINSYIAKTLFDFLPSVDHIHFEINQTAIPEPLRMSRLMKPYDAAYAFNISRINIFRLLFRLSERILKREENYIITGNDDGFQLLLYNYCHYKPDLVNPNELTKLPLSSLYSAFSCGETKRISITLLDIHGNYHVKKFRLNSNHGSVFDAWLQIGAPKHISDDELQHILGHILPDYSVKSIHAKGSYTFEATLSPHEVEYIEISHETTEK